MQLQFTAEELKLVVEILETRDNELTREGRTEEQKRVADLLDQILSKRLQFSVDELEDLGDILAEFKFDRPGDPEVTRKKELLTHITEKVAEARVMA